MLNIPNKDEPPTSDQTTIPFGETLSEVLSEDPPVETMPETGPDTQSDPDFNEEESSPPAPSAEVQKPVEKAEREHELLLSLGAKIETIQADLSRICLKIDNKIMIDEIRDRTIDELSSELKVLRENQLFRAMKPLINGIIDVADDMSEVMKNLAEGDDALRLIKYFHTMLHDVLATVDVNPFTSDNQAYDATRNSIVNTQNTVDPAMDKVNARSVLTGYCHNEEIMRKEKVIVYKYIQPVEESSTLSEQQIEQTIN